MKEWPYRYQWWVLCATYAAVLFVQRNNLSDPTIATVFLIVGGLLDRHGVLLRGLDLSGLLLIRRTNPCVVGRPTGAKALVAELLGLLDAIVAHSLGALQQALDRR